MQDIYTMVPAAFRERAVFLIRAGYLPRFANPVTYNQKINYRKLHWTNPLFVTCSDKIAVKDHVAKAVGAEHIIESVFTGSRLTLKELKGLVRDHGSLVVKANHNSGPVHFVTPRDSDAQLEAVCQSLKQQLTEDYGKRKQETWYSHITPGVLIEKMIVTPDGADLWDYKFHVFDGAGQGDPTIVLHVDYDRYTAHHRSFYDEELNWLPFSMKYPTLKTRIERPQNYDRMLDIVKTLARPFSYSRVDLYNVEGKIYFGEITFAHGAGRQKFSSMAYDKWMGDLWKGDPAT